MHMSCMQMRPHARTGYTYIAICCHQHGLAYQHVPIRTARDSHNVCCWSGVCRGNVGLLARTAHGADVHPGNPSSIIVFGGYGGPATSPYTFLNDIVVLHTDRWVDLNACMCAGTGVLYNGDVIHRRGIFHQARKL